MPLALAGLLAFVIPAATPARAAAASGAAPASTDALFAAVRSPLRHLTKAGVWLPRFIDAGVSSGQSFVRLARIDEVGVDGYTVSVLRTFEAAPADIGPASQTYGPDDVLARISGSRTPPPSWKSGKKLYLPDGSAAFYTAPSREDAAASAIFARAGAYYRIVLAHGGSADAALATAASMRPAGPSLFGTSTSDVLAGDDLLAPVLPLLEASSRVPVLWPASFDLTTLYGVAPTVTSDLIGAAPGSAPGTPEYRYEVAGPAYGPFPDLVFEGSQSPFGPTRFRTNVALEGGMEADYEPGGCDVELDNGRGCVASTPPSLTFHLGTDRWYRITPHSAVTKAQLIAAAANMHGSSATPVR